MERCGRRDRGCFFRHPPGGEAKRISLASDAPSYAWPCGEGVGERLWFPTDAGLFVLGPEDAAPRRVPGPPLDPDVMLEVVAEDLEGNVWAGHDDTICHAPIDSLQWSCETVPGMLRLRALRAMPSGDLWAATDSSGVWRRRKGRFEAIPASRMLASPTTRALVPSPAGGVWIVGEANCLRVAERPDLAGRMGAPGARRRLAGPSHLGSSWTWPRIPTERCGWPRT